MAKGANKKEELALVVMEMPFQDFRERYEGNMEIYEARNGSKFYVGFWFKSQNKTELAVVKGDKAFIIDSEAFIDFILSEA